MVVWTLALVTACGGTAGVAGTDATTGATTAAVVSLGPLPIVPIAPVADPTIETAVVAPSSTASTTPATTTTTATLPAVVTVAPATSRPAVPKTACTDVAYIGDSVSLGMTPAAGFDARLASVGVTGLRVEVSGGRSIVETLPGQENAAVVAARLRADGFAGCWVIAVGTNDAANIAAGGARQADERIASMMTVIGRDPVLWIDAASIATTGFWAAPNIDAWNQVLTTVVSRYPNMRIASWSTTVASPWFEPDGVHITAAGAAARIELVADALVADFPLR